MVDGYVLAYDSGCGPCTNFKRLVDFLDARKAISYRSLSEADEEGLLDRVPLQLRHRSFHLISADGTVLSGADALPSLMAVLPAGGLASRIIPSAPGLLGATGFVYSALSRLHDSGSCQHRVSGGPAVSAARKERHRNPAFFGTTGAGSDRGLFAT